ncbi:MAG: tetratricopeptide repeat protein [Luteolibacter sp.]
MKNPLRTQQLPQLPVEFGKLPDLRIDFDAAAALIAPRNFASFQIMSADLKESPVPLAEISQGPNAFEAFLDRNQKGLIVFAILLAIGAVCAVIYRGVERSRQESAGAALTKANDLASLQAVVDGHSGTIAARSAMILLAESQWTDGQKDEAIGTLQKFIADSPTHPTIPTAKANLGSKLMSQGKTGDATRVFEELVSDSSARFITPFALISLGDIAKAAGETEKAEISYNKAKSDFPASSFADMAAKRLAILKAKPPEEIEAPPAPEKPADPLEALKAQLPAGVTVTPSPTPPETPAPDSGSPLPPSSEP